MEGDKSMILVIGATGLLGGEIVRQLRFAEHAVRCLVRTTSNSSRVEALQQTGAEIVYGDLQDPSSLQIACTGIEAIVTTASCTFSRQPGDSIQTVDRDGYFSLIDAAKNTGVRNFVYTSIPQRMRYESPLTRAKGEIGEYLKSSGMDYTVLAANFFMEIWLSPALGFDAQNARAIIYGTGDRPVGFVSYRDVAQIAVRSLAATASKNRTISIAGPANVAPREVLQIFERSSGRTFAVEHVDEDTLIEKHRRAADPLEETFAALMLDYANGCPMDMKETLSLFPIQLTSVPEYADSIFHAESAHA
jgi:uncharacterized protein YbjT (DUF2867 family)